MHFRHRQTDRQTDTVCIGTAKVVRGLVNSQLASKELGTYRGLGSDCGRGG